MTLPHKTYSLIYADPPWSFSDAQANRPFNYDRMDSRAVRELPVINIADKNCALFLWATDTHFAEALRVIDRWGFLYRSVAFVWSKRASNGNPHMGMGMLTRKSCEFCLYSVRGKMKRLDAGVRQLIESVPGQHSEKPDEVRERIVKLFGDLPRIELFARQRAPGWDAWGRQCPTA